MAAIWHTPVFNWVHPDDRELVLTAVRDFLETGHPYVIEFRVVRDDGQIRWIAARGDIVRDDGRSSETLRGVAYDVTEKREAQDSIAKLNVWRGLLLVATADGSLDPFLQRVQP